MFYINFFPLSEFCQKLLLHLCSSASFAWFLTHKRCTLNLEEVMFEYCQLSCPYSLWDLLPWSFTKHFPEEAKVCSPEVQGSELAACPLCCHKDLKLHQGFLWASPALLDSQNRAQHAASPFKLFYELKKDIFINTFQRRPDLLIPCWAVPPTGIWVVGIPRNNCCLWIWDCSYLSA